MKFIYIFLFFAFFSCQNQEETIKVGILHSLSGTMAISETDVKNASLMAIDEINESGGLLGKKVEAVIVDGKSDWAHFAKMADSLITKAKVAVVFGCWTSASRRTVKPVFEKYNHLLFYPVQYEGLEQSPNIVYTGAAPNQQIIPAVKWCIEQKKKRFFLVGSDYVFPQTANKIIKEQMNAFDAQIVGEEYVKLGSQEVQQMIEKIKIAKPDVILNTINGDTNVAFFEQLQKAGINKENTLIMSFSLAEAELQAINIENMVGHYATWNYFQSIQSKENDVFIANFKQKYGQNKVTDDPIEAGYFGVHLWAQAVRKANAFDVISVKQNLAELSFNAPEGLVYIDAKTQHTWKPVRIGKIKANGQFEIVWDSQKPVRPVPYPTYFPKNEWDQFLQTLYTNWKGNWANLD